MLNPERVDETAAPRAVPPRGIPIRCICWVWELGGGVRNRVFAEIDRVGRRNWRGYTVGTAALDAALSASAGPLPAVDRAP
jgi:hypothetical protein